MERKTTGQLTYKQNEIILQTHFIVLLSCVVVLPQVLKLGSPNLLIEINKQQTAKRARTPVFLVCFSQKAKANNKSVTVTLAPPAFMIMPTKIP